MTQLRADNARLADEVAEAEAQRDACAADRDDCENQVRRTRTELLEAQGEIRRLARQLDIKKVEAAAARRAAKTAQQRIADLERQLAGESPATAPSGNEADSDSYRPLPQSFP